MSNNHNTIGHIFAVCAYKESPFLEDCIKSLISQSEKSNIIICTSTPNDFIRDIAEKYYLPIYLNLGTGTMADNWNFAYKTANAQYVTICHQDDIYTRDYLKEIKKAISQNGDDILLLHTNWAALKNGKTCNNICQKIHRLLNFPIKFAPFNKFLRICALSVGCSIKTPSACYNKKLLQYPLWTEDYKICLDWQAFYNIAKFEGKFIYIAKKLLLYRIHKDTTTFELIHNNIREKEDLEMFQKFWPKLIAKTILSLYKKAYVVYRG